MTDDCGTHDRDKLYIFSGYDGSYRNDFNAFDFATAAWAPVPSAGKVSTHVDVHLIMGGSPAMYAVCKVCYRHNPHHHSQWSTHHSLPNTLSTK